MIVKTREIIRFLVGQVRDFAYQAFRQYLTQYRAYDPGTGRWVLRDPIEEQGGINLYGYAGGKSINGVDPDGLSINPNRPFNSSLNRSSGNDVYNDDNASRPILVAGGEGAPGNNQAQNKQFRDIVNQLGLTPAQQRLLHDEISGQNMRYHEILQTARDMFDK